MTRIAGTVPAVRREKGEVTGREAIVNGTERHWEVCVRQGPLPSHQPPSPPGAERKVSGEGKMGKEKKTTL